MLVLMVVSIPEWLYQFLKNKSGILKTSDGIEYVGCAYYGVERMLNFYARLSLISKDYFIEKPNKRVVDRNNRIGSFDNNGNIYVRIGCRSDIHKKKEYITLDCVGAKSVLYRIYALFDSSLHKYIGLYKVYFRNNLQKANTTLLIKCFMEINGIDVTKKNFGTIEKRIIRNRKR